MPGGTVHTPAPKARKQADYEGLARRVARARRRCNQAKRLVKPRLDNVDPEPRQDDELPPADRHSADVSAGPPATVSPPLDNRQRFVVGPVIADPNAKGLRVHLTDGLEPLVVTQA